MGMRLSLVPYRGKFSREKTFAKTTNRKISRRKLSPIHTIDLIWVAHACDVCEENFRERAQIHEIRESFLPRKFSAIRYYNSIELTYTSNSTYGINALVECQSESPRGIIGQWSRHCVLKILLLNTRVVFTKKFI